MGFFNKLFSAINGVSPKSAVLTDNLQTESILSHDSPSTDNISQNDADGRFSTSLPQQRYAWHNYLLCLLKAIKVNDIQHLRYFTIYIQKNNGLQYQWNDDTFKAELQQEIKNARLSHIGKSSFAIQLVSPKVFQMKADKKIGETQYVWRVDDVLFCGSKIEMKEERFATTIDKRAFIIKELLAKFRNKAGGDGELMQNLTIIVVHNDDDGDMARYDWVGPRFVDDLKRALADNYLHNIGSQSLQIVLKPKHATENCHPLIDNQVYYQWGRSSIDYETKDKDYMRVVANISILEQSGSLEQRVYTLDSDKQQLFHIGRGRMSHKSGKYHVNDIVINDQETDLILHERNIHVSRAHADIIFKNYRFYLKALPGGCRTLNGSPTKIIRNENNMELCDVSIMLPLEDGDMIELGKKVVLIYTEKKKDDY